MQTSRCCHEPKNISPVEEFLLVTLMVKLAVVAVLATMLVRFPWFRRILLTEKRDWPERLVFAASLGVPLTAGVLARLLVQLRSRRPDALGLVPGRPPCRTLRRRHRRVDDRHAGPACRRVDRAALRDRLRLCRRRPAGDLPKGSDLALLAALLHRSAPLRVAPGAAASDRLGRPAARRADQPRAACGSGSATRFGHIFYPSLSPRNEAGSMPRLAVG